MVKTNNYTQIYSFFVPFFGLTIYIFLQIRKYYPFDTNNVSVFN